MSTLSKDTGFFRPVANMNFVVAPFKKAFRRMIAARQAKAEHVVRTYKAHYASRQRENDDQSACFKGTYSIQEIE